MALFNVVQEVVQTQRPWDSASKYLLCYVTVILFTYPPAVSKRKLIKTLTDHIRFLAPGIGPKDVVIILPLTYLDAYESEVLSIRLPIGAPSLVDSSQAPFVVQAENSCSSKRPCTYWYNFEKSQQKNLAMFAHQETSKGRRNSDSTGLSENWLAKKNSA
jgi:hypothetical protein